MLDTAPDNSLRIERLSPKAASVIETFATEVVEAFKDYRSSALGQESLGKCFNSDPKRDWINNRRVRAKKKLARLLLAKDRTTPPEHLRELAVGDIALNYLSLTHSHLVFGVLLEGVSDLIQARDLYVQAKSIAIECLGARHSVTKSIRSVVEEISCFE